MKVASLVRLLATAAAVVLFGCSALRAQTEIDPDHFDFTNVDPFPQPVSVSDNRAALVQYNGNLTPSPWEEFMSQAHSVAPIPGPRVKIGRAHV